MLVNGPEPTSRKQGCMPILNRLRPKEFFERDRCTSGWSDIYDHSTNPVNLHEKLQLFIRLLAERLH